MLGWHLIFSVYGFWLPNDERGSGSVRVRAQHIYDAGGKATKVHTTHSVAHRPHDVRLRKMAKESLTYPAVELSGLQARAVTRWIAAICPKIELVVHACAIMPDHVHVVVAAHRFNGDELIACLKRTGTRGMNDEGLHPMRNHSRKRQVAEPLGGTRMESDAVQPGANAGRHSVCGRESGAGRIQAAAMVFCGAVFGVVREGGMGGVGRRWIRSGDRR